MHVAGDHPGTIRHMTDELRPGAATALALLPCRAATAARLGARWGDLVEPSGPAVVVGAGGSHPPAEYIARLLRAGGSAARAAYPLDADGPEQRLIAVTYSGSTPDADFAAAQARRRGAHVAFITAAAAPKLATPGDVVWCHRDPAGTADHDTVERGFLSLAATVAPAAAALAAIEGTPVAIAALDAATVTGPLDRLAGARTVEVVASGWAWPAALDVESKWAEAALGVVRLHETKNLSHGRWISLFDQPTRPVFVHIVAGHSRVEAGVAAALAAHGEVITVTGPPGPAGGLAALAAVQRFAPDAGAARGRDVSRPAHLPPDGVTLYNLRVS